MSIVSNVLMAANQSKNYCFTTVLQVFCKGFAYALLMFCKRFTPSVQQVKKPKSDADLGFFSRYTERG